MEPPRLLGTPATWRTLFDVDIRHVVIALILLCLAGVATRLVNAAIKRTLDHHRERGSLMPETTTRLQVSRRLVDAAIWLVAISMALTQFPELHVLSAGLLASAGISGIIVGFAAKSTLGNAIAGVMISFAQPVRIGDDIELRGERGVVEDITLLFTVVRLVDGKRLIIPNDTLSTEVIKNLTLGGATRIARIDVLVPPKSDASAIRTVLLGVAAAHPGIDRDGPPPRVDLIRVDERGALVRLTATCVNPAAADELAQAAMARASERLYGIAW
ncbi:MAG: mechanosensitive ion channel [Deltaproteobacteria bacterium]|nr:MAG: mechanosensitive ion channel [Deltaproteobacteria bacterium]TMB36058.1 MAG: mechanosensitive ion channel [Deltaproteobacteria bacterium]